MIDTIALVMLGIFIGLLLLFASIILAIGVIFAFRALLSVIRGATFDDLIDDVTRGSEEGQ